MQAPSPELKISPPLLNSANPWCTTLDDLQRLHACPHTGALTTRTSLLAGFAHDDASHQYVFFDPTTTNPSAAPNSSTPEAPLFPTRPRGHFISQLPETPPIKGDHGNHGHHGHHRKLIIISVTGSPSEIAQCYALIASFSSTTTHPLAMEINLSCPNIATAAPPASDRAQLLAYLAALPRDPLIPIGLKTPPYTHLAHYAELIAALREDSTVVTPKAMLKVPCKISFITAVNTLGSCLLLEAGDSRLPGSGFGGMAGAPLHPLALGNVKTIAELVAREPELLHIKVIGVGGVSDADGFRRMKSVGS
ncbi:dihydroorotate dehydrogenase [Colletotrichum fioriniae]|uniref:dihydroorotate dehydrogenase n=1 Tax=Colletotrichum fioriniae TaxID=710243 RepID=UPI0032DA14B6|nr:dihydroorotate dehydrogenase [Colletotrichum fioriniae]